MKKWKEIIIRFLNYEVHIRTWILASVCGAAILMIALPYLFMEKPYIQSITPTEAIESSSFNEDNSLLLTGEGFDYILGVYVNGVWEPDCTILLQEDNQIKILLPNKYFSTPGSYSIQLQCRINSDLTAMSNKAKFRVLSTNAIEKPKITGTDTTALEYTHELVSRVTIMGENFDENSIVYMDNQPVTTKYEDGNLTAYLPFDAWAAEEYIMLSVVQYFDGYATSVQSENYWLEVKPAFNAEAENIKEILLLQYLQCLSHTDYLVVFSACDDASVSVTPSIVEMMQKLGLQVNLTGKLRQGYIAVWNAGNVLYEQISEESLCYDVEDIEDWIHVESAGFLAGNYSIIEINGRNYSINSRGLNIVVYDKEEKTVVDSVCFDLYEGLDARRAN